MGAPLSGPEPLAAHHDTSAFDCGHPALNAHLTRFALVNQAGGAARTYVALRGARVVGYYNLAAASARLAVDRSEQGAGLGEALLKDAIKRHLQAERIIASRALLVHAKDERAAAFYKRYGFQPSPTDPFHLYLLTKDMKKTLGIR